MKDIAVDQICHWIHGKIIQQGKDDLINHITIDSRQARKGCMFVPLEGEHVDGHAYIKDAANHGCSAALVRECFLPPTDLWDGMTLIKVNEPLQALQELAKRYREGFRQPVIAITGSNGKTTTKDMIAGVTGIKLNTLKSQGNKNNHIGLPLSILESDESHECMILEMGMSGLGEIGALSGIAQPDIAFITNVGWAHIEKLGTKENIAEAKMEIATGLKSNGTLVINGDQALLRHKAHHLKEQFNVVSIGLNQHNDVSAYEMNVINSGGFTFKTNLTENHVFEIKHPGIHHVTSALCALWTGLHFSLTYEEIQRGFDAFEASGMRMEHQVVKGRHVINDAYNANPDSMKAAIQHLRSVTGHRKIAVLGSMLELGHYAETCHRNLGDDILSAHVDELILVGTLAYDIGKEAIKNGFPIENVYYVDGLRQAATVLRNISKKDDTILVKGSRSMEMEKIIYYFAEGEN